jgi:MFS transporter, CP family, cyanate transporter
MIERRTRWPAVIAAVFAGVVGALAFGKMSPALPLLTAEFHLSLIQAGWLVSAFNALAASSAIFFGLFSDRVGALRLCIFGVLCLAAGGLLGALSSGAPLLVVSRLIEGLGFIAAVVSAPGLITAATAPGRLGVAFGLWGSYLPFGVSLALLASPPLFAVSGWRSIWVLAAIAALACALMLAAQSRHYAGVTGTRRSLASIKASLAQPVLWLLGVAFAVYAIQHIAVIIWLPTYLIETRGVSVTAAALATALAVFVNCFGNILGGWLIQRHVPRGRIIALTFMATSVTFVGIFSAALPDPVRYALVVFYSFITGTVPAAALSAGMRYARSPAEVGSIQGLIVHLTHIGIFFGPPLIAAAVTWGGSWDATLWVMLGCAVVALVCAFAIGRYERAATPA